MSAPYKAAIIREENAINEEPIELRADLLKFLFTNKCSSHVSEAANGSNINLDNLPENILKQFYYFMCKKMDIPTEEFQ